MSALIFTVGLLQIVAGVLVALSAKSAIHEILGAIAFGLGVLSLAMAVIISRIDTLIKAKKLVEQRAIDHATAVSAHGPKMIDPT